MTAPVWPRKPTHRRGAHSEMVAAAWAYDNGYEVFKNMAPAGPIDLVLHKAGVTLLCDVKTANGKPGLDGRVWSGTLTPTQRAAGIVRLTVLRDGSAVFLDSGEKPFVEGE